MSPVSRTKSRLQRVQSHQVVSVLFDIGRYHTVVRFGVILVILIGIDMTGGMPLSWTFFEGPPTFIVGLVVLWLQRRIGVNSDEHDDL